MLVTIFWPYNCQQVGSEISEQTYVDYTLVEWMSFQYSTSSVRALYKALISIKSFGKKTTFDAIYLIKF